MTTVSRLTAPDSDVTCVDGARKRLSWIVSVVEPTYTARTRRLRSLGRLRSNELRRKEHSRRVRTTRVFWIWIAVLTIVGAGSAFIGLNYYGPDESPELPTIRLRLTVPVQDAKHARDLVPSSPVLVTEYVSPSGSSISLYFDASYSGLQWEMQLEAATLASVHPKHPKAIQETSCTAEVFCTAFSGRVREDVGDVQINGNGGDGLLTDDALQAWRRCNTGKANSDDFDGQSVRISLPGYAWRKASGWAKYFTALPSFDDENNLVLGPVNGYTELNGDKSTRKHYVDPGATGLHASFCQDVRLPARDKVSMATPNAQIHGLNEFVWDHSTSTLLPHQILSEVSWATLAANTALVTSATLISLATSLFSVILGDAYPRRVSEAADSSVPGVRGGRRRRAAR